MSGATGWALIGGWLWLVVLCVWGYETRKWIRLRREERKARERRDRQAALEKDVEDTMLLLGQREAGRRQ